jgi:hypothetical protein
MAKAKPKQAAKPKPKPSTKANAKPMASAKPKPRTAGKSRGERGAIASAVGKPLVVTDGNESGVGINAPHGTRFNDDSSVDPGPNGIVDRTSGAAFTLVNTTLLSNNTILSVSFFLDGSQPTPSGAGTLRLTLINLPGTISSPVDVPVDYVDDLP